MQETLSSSTLPRFGGVSMTRVASAPRIGPRSGPFGGDTCSVRLVQLTDSTGAKLGGADTFYSLPPVSLTRPKSRGAGSGSTFGPEFGRPFKPRFAEPNLLTAKAYSANLLPHTNVFKERRAPSPTWHPALFDGPRSEPAQWTPRSVHNVMSRRSYRPAADAMPRPMTRRRAERGAASSPPSRASSRRSSETPAPPIWHRRSASDPSDVMSVLRAERLELVRIRSPSPVLATGDVVVDDECA